MISHSPKTSLSATPLNPLYTYTIFFHSCTSRHDHLPICHSASPRSYPSLHHLLVADVVGSREKPSILVELSSELRVDEKRTRHELSKTRLVL